MNAAKLKQNAFWVGCGAAIVVLGALYQFMYAPRSNEYAKQVNTIRRSNETLKGLVESGTMPGTPDIDNWKKYRSEITARLEELVKFYKDQDEALEQWLPELNCASNKYPDQGDFLSKWNTKKMELDEQAKIPGSTERFDGFKWEEVTGDALTAGPREPIMKDLQKMYWIRVRIWDALQKIVKKENEQNQRVTELQEICWLESIYDRYHNNALKPPPTFPAPQIMLQRYPAIVSNKEFGFPGGMGRTITFGITLKIRLSELPNFMADLLTRSAPGGAPGLLIELLGTRMEPADTNEFIQTKDVEQGAQEDSQLQEYYKKVMPQPVIVRISARILDFDRARLEEKQKLVDDSKPKN